jgi:hypothetical protein
MSLLPISRAHELASASEERRWLIDGLWLEEAVGIIGGEPKCCKSFLALDMAVSVAAARPCLRRFAVSKPGRVLLYAAEDALPTVRARLDGIAHAAGATLKELDILVITKESLRLDLAADQARLLETVDATRPRLLVLDPFVRLHRIDENASAEVAPLLGYLRELQRRFSTAVAVVHHARKGGSHLRAGQALRGSSEFHAWGDSNLYLRRSGERLTLSVEHRAAASPADLALSLDATGTAVALAVSSDQKDDAPQAISAADRLEQVLAAHNAPLSFAALRSACRMRTQSLCDLLAELTQAGRVAKTERGYQLADH